VNSENKLLEMNISNEDSIQVKVNNKDSDKFYFKKRDGHSIEKSEYKMPEKLIAISDIEGNFNAFSSFLKNNGVVDSNFNWTFGNGHLVLVGDFVDRGNNVTQVLWLIYKLEEQAEKKGGKVHFILGNHEIMNFQGNDGYNQEKYIKVAQEISKKEEWEKAIQFMFSDNTELGNWLRTKNVIKKIGDYIFVHAGLHPELLDYKIANFLVGRISPIWYRGLVTDYKYYEKINETDLNKVLEYYNVKNIVVGHTVVRNISTDFNGKVIRIDLKHGIEKNSGFTKGLLIENGVQYIIDDNGNKETLK
jgi:calcineurin-like phosphoesterase family protein